MTDVDEYGEESTPELDELQQLPEDEGLITVPVRLVESGPVDTYPLPARHAAMGSVVVDDTTQHLLGRDIRRKSVTVWATSDTSGGHVFIGVDKNMVENEAASRLPASVDSLVEGPPVMLNMTHVMPLWVKNTGVNPITVSYVAEYWAD